MEEYFKDKKVLITGHTGFKGSWLSLWLSMMGAKIYGISISVPTEPSHYDLLDLNFIQDIRLDISNSSEVEKAMNFIQPDYIFHLAAQPLVAESYINPLNTFNTNIIGTASLLESLRKTSHRCVSVLITSDKVYDNLEIKRGYHENDKLGGADPYSGSKGAAELVISSYARSFFHNNEYVSIGIGRAGNVIGGGDWANNRIIPDIIKSISNNQILKIRSPQSTRPWQHVLEPISGYLSLAIDLKDSSKNNNQAFNFGPSFDEDYTVEQVLKELKKYFKTLNWQSDSQNQIKEAKLLKLDCKKAENILKWRSCLDFEETLSYTSNWYLEFFKDRNQILKFSKKQINDFILKAKSKKIEWTQH